MVVMFLTTTNLFGAAGAVMVVMFLTATNLFGARRGGFMFAATARLSSAAMTVANELVFANFRLLSLACATLGASRLTVVRHWRKKFF
jgi:hypothetical protein